ncbi:hypothetical protein DTO013E5_4247 [Penicillium roqueforti]|uniref:Genomic scaffold, ProqFM164S01 n=1 Tax=Penicillium roqueforti (strain FM164) TaxID=1365484 RepID=W6PYL9_PENRF|nr:uncharacterized protein LCP9604111_4233 [Penicillium roqueforti]CDM27059.1 unnamed protein product [Penicillium roqueforti FM164]KAF9249604.1 hypothetical protein LCP9604111_4233 [Penicillium roqueforti]KAI1835145.1 hypothetical protein CBS147337_3962 [Penicillium roqueforti]KAI2677158.1 hypothetical protein CBS147355_5385 [Penicillium roqueforti]KAI2688544.1 hypothetical protein LCP963914a_2946 [Penicillium roqueforti]
MGKSTPIEPAPAYDDLFHERGSSSRNGYAMVGQTDDTTDETRDVEQGLHIHGVPAPIEVTAAGELDQHTHCAECDRQQERRERRESSQKACGMVATTFILISLFLMILGIVIVGAWKDVRMKKSHG